MTPSAEHLRRVLEVERARGFSDTAVIGGLDRMLRTMLSEGAIPPGTPAHEALATLPARGYGSMSAEARADWSRRVLRGLDRPMSAPQPSAARSRFASAPPA